MERKSSRHPEKKPDEALLLLGDIYGDQPDHVLEEHVKHLSEEDRQVELELKYLELEQVARGPMAYVPTDEFEMMRAVWEDDTDEQIAERISYLRDRHLTVLGHYAVIRAVKTMRSKDDES
ncbi:hypothetical protein [Curtobacterium sp. MCSS17_007]|uniref:hypothetical protein n=1 Tax=Curtobacterium sp. MCSS17_007 TaxID=2175646 RepID=UPI000DA9F01D|nr:hypothetical protein [Curtobacterium sp. MCSS17_007]WIE74518.1 hypothetical protein DEJ22_009505 [Curtobacterium sp. MCSS17_007]